MKIVILDTEERRKRLVDALGRIPLDPPIQVTIEEYDPKRSSQANRRYWLLLEEAHRKTGTDKDDLHEFFKEKFLGTRVVEIFGERTVIRPTTARLGRRPFREYVDKVEDFLIEKAGVWLE